MAKILGLGGYLSGKKGDTVFSPLRDGISVARQWRDTIANPRTAGQVSQRNKLALTGRLSSIVPASALLGFIGNRAGRRSKFNQRVLDAAVVVDGSARIDPRNILFSEGTLGASTSSHAYHRTDSGFTSQVVVDTITSPELLANRPIGYTEELIVLAFNEVTSAYDYCGVYMLAQPTAAGSDAKASTTINLSFGALASSYTFVYYLIPSVPKETTLSQKYSYLGIVDGFVAIDDTTGKTISLERGQSRFSFVQTSA